MDNYYTCSYQKILQSYNSLLRKIEHNRNTKKARPMTGFLYY